MFLIFTVPLAVLLLDMVAVAVAVQGYRMLWGFKRPGLTAKSVRLKILLSTGAYQLGWCGLVLVADAGFRLSSRSNEVALQLLLLSSFVIPPLLLLLKRRNLSIF